MYVCYLKDLFNDLKKKILLCDCSFCLDHTVFSTVSQGLKECLKYCEL